MTRGHAPGVLWGQGRPPPSCLRLALGAWVGGQGHVRAGAVRDRPPCRRRGHCSLVFSGLGPLPGLSWPLGDLLVSCGTESTTPRGWSPTCRG